MQNLGFVAFFFLEIQFILTSSTLNDKNVIKQKRYLLISSALTFPNLYGIHIHTLKCRYLFNSGRRNTSMVAAKESNL